MDTLIKRQNMISEPILEKNRQIGNQTIQPMGGNSFSDGKAAPTSFRTTSSNQPITGSLGEPDLTPTGTVQALAQPDIKRTLGDEPVKSDALATATAQNVNRNDLVSNNINDLLSEKSKYLQLARTGAAQTAAKRNLLNSSIAAGAGEAAAIAYALPIAQQDANTNFSANTNTVNSKNRFAENQQNQNFNLSRDYKNAGYTQDNAILQSDINKQIQERDQNNALKRNEQQQSYSLQRDNINAGYTQDNMILQGGINTEAQKLDQTNALARGEQQQEFNLQRDSVNAGYTQDNIKLQGDINEQTQARDQANRLINLDKSAFIQTQRDRLLQGFQTANIDQNQANNLETLSTQFAEAEERARFNVGSNFQAQYLSASSNLQNTWSAEVQAIYGNSNMTPEQQTRAVNEATARYQNQAEVLAQQYSEMGAWNVVVEQFPPSPIAPPPGTGNTGTGTGDTGTGTINPTPTPKIPPQTPDYPPPNYPPVVVNSQQVAPVVSNTGLATPVQQPVTQPAMPDPRDGRVISPIRDERVIKRIRNENGGR